MVELNVYTLLDSVVMTRILEEFWESNIETDGHILNLSSAYRILATSDKGYLKDYEAMNRFYQV